MVDTYANTFALLAALGCVAVTIDIARLSRARAACWLVAACFWLTFMRLASVADLGWITGHKTPLSALSIVLLLGGLLGLDLAMRGYEKRNGGHK